MLAGVIHEPDELTAVAAVHALARVFDDGADAVLTVARAAAELGWGTAGVVASPLPGPAGNVEFFLWLRRDAPPPEQADIDRAVQEGPP